MQNVWNFGEIARRGTISAEEEDLEAEVVYGAKESNPKQIDRLRFVRVQTASLSMVFIASMLGASVVVGAIYMAIRAIGLS